MRGTMEYIAYGLEYNIVPRPKVIVPESGSQVIYPPPFLDPNSSQDLSEHHPLCLKFHC